MAIPDTLAENRASLPPNSMTHETYGVDVGIYEEYRELAKKLRKIGDEMCKTYDGQKTNKPPRSCFKCVLSLGRVLITCACIVHCI